MPQVRFLTDVAGPQSLWEAGDVVAMTIDQAKVWADGVRAELVRPGSVSENPERNAARRGGVTHIPETR